MVDLAQLLGAGVAAARFGRLPAPWGVIRIRGRDAVDFVHRLCSQDVAAMPDGSVRAAAFLDGKGRLRAACRIGRLDDTLWLEAPEDRLPVVADLVERYHIAERLEIDRLEEWRCAELLGADAPAVAGLEPDRCRAFDGGVVLSGLRHGVGWARWHAGADCLADEPWSGAEVLPGTEEIGEVFRIVSRRAAFGRDVDESTLALEADLDDHVSTTKGCYTGQEIVARLKTYGHLNRRLCLLTVEGEDDVEPGTELRARGDEKRAGRITSSVVSPAGGRRLALGVVEKRHWEPGTELALGSEDGRAARIEG